MTKRHIKLLLGIFSIAALCIYFFDEKDLYIEPDKWNLRNCAVYKLCRGQLVGVSAGFLKVLLGEPAVYYQHGDLVLYIYDVAGNYRQIAESTALSRKYMAEHPNEIFGVPAAESPDACSWFISISKGTVIQCWTQFHNRYSL